MTRLKTFIFKDEHLPPYYTAWGCDGCGLPIHVGDEVGYIERDDAWLCHDCVLEEQ